MKKVNKSLAIILTACLFSGCAGNVETDKSDVQSSTNDTITQNTIS